MSAGTKTKLGYRHDGQKGNIMNYRIIARYSEIRKVKVQKGDFDQIARIARSFSMAIANGARIGYEVQYHSCTGKTVVIKQEGVDIGRWATLPWVSMQADEK